MNKRDILELKRRFKKTNTTFTKVCGCYVNSEKDMLVKIDELFLNLADEEFYKYLEIANKTLSGTLGNQLLELEFPLDEEGAGGKQQFLMGLRDSDLKNEELLDRFYEHIIEQYSYVGNYLILLFHDVYDVIVKTNDNLKIDESEEVYKYIICAICPVTLSKPGLGYLTEENRIGARIRDWIVGAPETGFLFPAFTDRSSDIHSLLYYTKDTKDPRPEFMENGLGCPARQTATEQKITFQDVLQQTMGADTDLAEQVSMELQQNIQNMVAYQEDVYGKDADPILLTVDTIKEALEDIEAPTELLEKVEIALTEEFSDVSPVAELLIDTKALAANEIKQKEKSFIQEIHTLKEQLAETTAKANEDDKEFENMIHTSDVILKVRTDKVPEIQSQIIDGERFLMIPV